MNRRMKTLTNPSRRALPDWGAGEKDGSESHGMNTFVPSVSQFNDEPIKTKIKTCNRCLAGEKSRVQTLSGFGFVLRFLGITALLM